MKIRYIKSIALFTVVTSLFLTSCSDDFLQEKKDYAGVNDEIFQSPALAKQYVDYVYASFEPTKNTNFTWDLVTGGDNTFSKTSDELAGETNYNKVWGSISYDQAMCLPYLGAKLTASVANNTWTRIREINLFLEGIDKYGMADASKNPLKGQMYFWRAYQYYEMVKMYGGVPLVLTSQNPIIDATSTSQIARSSTSACIEQIVADLDMAKSLLPGKWTDGNDWGRITSGAAAAFKGRVLLTWASPLFNPTDDTARWQRAYDANLEAKTLLETNGFGLFATGGTANGVAWGNMWSVEKNNPEAVLVFGFNNSTQTTDAAKNSGMENATRSVATGGAGSLAPTKQIVDAFPTADGQPITSSTGTYAYDPVVFYKNRDPRFYKTFAYNGAIWKYAENTNYKQWTYSWTKAGTGTPNLFTETSRSSTAIYLRKANSDAASNVNNFKYSGTDFIELRFAEVVLNLAESAIGINKLTEGRDLIKLIRVRAGVLVGDGQYGLASATTRNQLFAATLNERKVEFAYENKRFYDLRRWMLFDDALGWNTKLGVPMINGSRRTGYFIVAKKDAATNYAGTIDPFYNATVGAATGTGIVRDPATYPVTVDGKSIANYDAYLENLYRNHFSIIEKDDLETTATTNWKFTWYNQYYFFGISQALINTAPYLEQTKGWGGTFDPLK